LPSRRTKKEERPKRGEINPMIFRSQKKKKKKRGEGGREWGIDYHRVGQGSHYLFILSRQMRKNGISQNGVRALKGKREEGKRQEEEGLVLRRAPKKRRMRA